MNPKVISVHSITDPENIPFSRKKYSRLKCGSVSIAKIYAKGIFEKFIENFKTSPEDSIIVYSSAYQHIPNAASIITKYFFYYLNDHLTENGMKPATLTKIIRNPTYFTDYGTLSKAEREKKIGKDQFYIDKNFVDGKVLIFIDDIRITGTHENKIQKSLVDLSPKDVYYLYWSIVDSDEINPDIEASLNYAEISDLKGLLNLYESDSVEFIVRTIRYILQAPKDEFLAFIYNRTRQDKETIYHLGVSEGYKTVPQFKRNLERLKKLISQ